MGLRKKTNRERELEGVNLLGLAPLRIADWEEVEGRVVMLRPKPFSVGLRGLMDRFFHRMSANRIRLDEVGSFAWRHLDGERTVAEVGELMRGEFGDRVDPVGERLGHFVQVMRTEGFLAYLGWDGETGEGRGRKGCEKPGSRTTLVS
ncbi:MAG: PqqD family protein [Gemmatimonadota bacterium]